MDNGVPKQLSEEAQLQFQLGIGFIISRWDSLQTALQVWRIRTARQKIEQLPLQILARFNQTKKPVYIEEMYGILDGFTESFKIVIDDGSLEEVALDILLMHEECFEGNFTSIERLKEAGPVRVSVPHIIEGLSDDSDSDSDSSSNSVDMIVDDDLPNPNQNDMVLDVPMVDVEDEGWTVVGRKKKRGPRKNQI